MHWVLLAMAVVFEVFGTTSMKLSEGFSRLLPSAMMAVFYLLSFSLLTLALRKIELSIAYAIWSGLGTAIVTVIGVILFKEGLSISKVVSIALIVAGVVSLHLSSHQH